MANNMLNPLPMLDLELPAIPPRSRLYSIEPIGLGTAEVESLTSYLTRLAHAHCVPVNKLAQLEFAPVLNKSEAYAFVEFNRITLNGLTDWTGLTIKALETLTCRHDLRFLAMYPWRYALAHKKLLRYHLAWCPACYAEWWQLGRAIYHPLLWSLDVVQICLRHQQPLSHHCPHPDCQKSLPLLLNKGKLGYCSSCQRWLGGRPGATQENVWDEREGQWHIWLTTQLGEMLMATPNLPALPQRHTVTENIKAWLQASASKSMRQLARQVGVASNKLWAWMNKDTLPELRALGQVCYHLDLSILDMLTTHPNPQAALDQSGLDHPVGVSRQTRTGHKIDPHQLSRQLEDFMPNKQASSVSAYHVAQQLGLSQTALRDNCPEQHRQIVERYQLEQQSRRQQRNEKLKQALKTCLESDEFPPPSLAEVERRLQVKACTAKQICPELSRLISNKYKAYRQTRKLNAESELKRILATPEEPSPSLTEVALTLGETTDYLYNLFPALCRTITQRHRASNPKNDQPSPGPHRSPGAWPTDHHPYHERFATIIAVEQKPPPTLAEVARRLGCSRQYLGYHHPTLCRQLRQQLAAYDQAQKETLERTLRDILAQNEDPPPSLRQVARRLGACVSTLKQQWPELSAEILRRFQFYRQTERQRRQAFLDQLLAENPTPSPSLSQVAQRLNCPASSLSTQFPEASQTIIARYQAYRQEKIVIIKGTLATILADRQNLPPPLLDVAQQLGYQTTRLLRQHFPDMCRQIDQRRRTQRRQILQDELTAILADSDNEPPPSLDEISLRLGCSMSTLADFFPDLYQAIITKRQNDLNRRKLALEQALKAVLEDEDTPPISLTAFAKEFGVTLDLVQHDAPDLAAAVTQKYKTHLKERSQQRRQKLIEDVKHITGELYREGIDPTLAQLARRLPQRKMVLDTVIREAWREARQKLGLSV